MRRTYKRDESTRAFKVRRTFTESDSGSFEGQSGTILERSFSNSGQISQLLLIVSGLSKEIVPLTILVKSHRRNQEISKDIRLKSGANHLGSFSIDAGDEIVVTLNTEELESPTVSLTYSYTFTNA